MQPACGLEAELWRQQPLALCWAAQPQPEPQMVSVLLHAAMLLQPLGLLPGNLFLQQQANDQQLDACLLEAGKSVCPSG